MIYKFHISSKETLKLLNLKFWLRKAISGISDRFSPQSAAHDSHHALCAVSCKSGHFGLYLIVKDTGVSYVDLRYWRTQSHAYRGHLQINGARWLYLSFACNTPIALKEWTHSERRERRQCRQDRAIHKFYP